MDAVEKAKSGHPGMPLGMADVVTVLFSKFLKFSTSEPKWHDRDRFVLSTGHGSMLLYSLYYLLGYRDITIEDIKNFRQLGAKTAGHPEYGFLEAIETTTGPLGQGMANAVGMAFAEKFLAKRYPDLVDHHTYCIVGDGCLMEGISQEAASFAAHYGLDKLIILFDDNSISIDGDVSVSTSEDQISRFKSLGFDTWQISGHDFSEIEQAISEAKRSNKPAFIACKTTIAYGCPNKGGTAASHGSPLGSEEIKLAKQNLSIDYPEFEIPEDILTDWRSFRSAGEKELKLWQERFANSSLKDKFQQQFEIDLEQISKEILQHKELVLSEKKSVATRQASGEALEFFSKYVENLVGGSADLTGSNNTKTSFTDSITPTDYSGRYVHYGIREHAMAAIMNGMSLHGGITPYSGTFLVFSDYCRPAIRLSGLMKQKVIYVMTHDSIGVGEDGPTHQPIEHIASLRAMPGVLVMRPCDIYETFACYEYVLSAKNDKPSVFCLSRQKVAFLNKQAEDISKGAYILRKEQGELSAVVIATGTEVEIAVKAQEDLAKENIHIRVVSMPCVELFKEATVEEREAIIGSRDTYKLAIEAASSFGWRDIVGLDGDVIGIDTFGESAPGDKLYEHFGITREVIIQKIKNNLAC